MYVVKWNILFKTKESKTFRVVPWPRFLPALPPEQKGCIQIHQWFEGRPRYPNSLTPKQVENPDRQNNQIHQFLECACSPFAASGRIVDPWPCVCLFPARMSTHSQSFPSCHIIKSYWNLVVLLLRLLLGWINIPLIFVDSVDFLYNPDLAIHTADFVYFPDWKQISLNIPISQLTLPYILHNCPALLNTENDRTSSGFLHLGTGHRRGEKVRWG